jgi:SPP1 family predicted phage head-tail adaptor
MTCAGELKHRLIIERRATVADDQGGTVTTWQEIGRTWAKATNGSLKERFLHGELQHMQQIAFEIRQKQRFCITPIEAKNYRITDARGNQYRVVNFEQSQFGLDFYRLVCEKEGATNE